MSLQDFWNDIRTVSGLVYPSTTVDSPTLDAGHIEKALRGAALWLTPKVVARFNPDDLDFLSKAEQAELQEAVSKFRSVADTAPFDRPPKGGQIDAALPALLKIIQIVRPDIYGDADAFAIGKRVERQLVGRLPKWVGQLKFETGPDANGEPALWVWVIADDKALRSEVLRENTRIVRQLINDAVLQLSLQYWPYIRFRSATEQAQQVAGSR